MKVGDIVRLQTRHYDVPLTREKVNSIVSRGSLDGQVGHMLRKDVGLVTEVWSYQTISSIEMSQNGLGCRCRVLVCGMQGWINSKFLERL